MLITGGEYNDIFKSPARPDAALLPTTRPDGSELDCFRFGQIHPLFANTSVTAVGTAADGAKHPLRAKWPK